VTGYRGEFGPAERAGVQVGWDIVGVSGTAHHTAPHTTPPPHCTAPH
jgi:hypothetical protein